MSGEGAARHGGRWNRPGDATLYFSEEIETAFAEYQQELGARPGTFVAYDVVGARVADLTRSASLAELAVDAGELAAAWKEMAFIDKTDPPTWRLADRLRPDFHGVRVASVRYPTGGNLVLWRWNVSDAPTVSYLDPRGELWRGGREQDD